MADAGLPAAFVQNFLQTKYEAFFFVERDVVVGYALVKMECKPLYLRQFLIIQEYREALWRTGIPAVIVSFASGFC